MLIVGLGGVGGVVTECLARSGIGRFTLVDGDVFESTNLNRQILCTEQTLGRNKAVIAKERIISVNSKAQVDAVSEYIGAENMERILGSGGKKFSYCVDAIDDIKNKIELIVACKNYNIPIISAMGAGNRMDCGFAACDLYKTKNDPLARKLRHELKARGVDSLDVVCADSPPLLRSGAPASIAPPPTVMGAMIAEFVISRLIA